MTAVQRHTFVAAFLGWTLDAFDFFLVTFVIKDIAATFHQGIVAVLGAITLTLMLRPLGALIFGVCADRFGRRGPLMINILLYSGLELATGFAPSFGIFLLLRGLYGIAMGGEWGVGAALALESLPAERRGFFSGVLQQGYAVGFLLAAIAFYVVFPHFGWRAMFFVGAAPALLVVYIRTAVRESDAWRKQKTRSPGDALGLWRSIVRRPGLYIYAVVLMTAFNFMSHGSQDLYPTFLREQRGLAVGLTSVLAIVANVGAIVGGTLFGGLSQHFGRRRTIVAAACLGILVIPLWVFSPSIALLGLGAFVLQFFVQGAWGVVPIHLNELSPPDVRGTFPGLTYQLGNLLSAGAAQIEAAFAKGTFPLRDHGGADYAKTLSIIMLIVFAAVASIASLGPERRGAELR